MSLMLVGENGQAFDTFVHDSSLFVAGQMGARYNLRLHNHTANRIEAVVSVDGRDVVSGELGNYKRQHGYVLEPYATVVIDGFRRSMNEVAAFRFSELHSSYSAQRGTAHNVGVIGVALFKAKTRRRRDEALAVYPSYQDADAFPASRPAKAAQRAKSGPSPTPPSDFDEIALADGADAESMSAGVAASEPSLPTMGTAYGEGRYSAVHEVAFKRRRKRRPDAMITMYYDSSEALAARGIAVPYIPARVAEPFPVRAR